MQPATNLDDLRRRAAKFMQLEELREFRNNARAEASGEKKEDRERQGRSRTGRDQKRDNRGPRFSRYTPLNADRSKILQEALSAELIPPPRRALSPENADRSKRCRYHKNTGHFTEECQALKDKIEELIQAGHLRRFVRGTRETRRSPCKEQTPRRRDRTPPGPREGDRRGDRRGRRDDPPQADTRRGREVINTIAGGFGGGGNSNSARKKHLRAIHQVNLVSARPRMPPITFTDEDFKGIDPTQDDPMVISVDIDNFMIKKTLVDQGSSVDILYWKTFKAMRIPEEEMMPYNDHVVGFSGERVGTKGYIELYTTFDLEGARKTLKIRYLVINTNTSYNILLGRSSLNKLGAIVSTPHLAMKFLSLSGDILTIHVDQKVARECYAESLRVEPTQQRPSGSRSPKRKIVGRGRSPHRHSPQPKKGITMADLDPREIEPRLEAKDELRQAELDGEDRYTSIGTAMAVADADFVHRTLKRNVDLFAWTTADVPGVHPDIITHRLSVYKEARPVAQKKRNYGEDKRLAARSEADKLLKAGFIAEARYSTWLANVVMVKKSSSKWRMCVDYKDLNKACPKDSYPLPNIDRLVDRAAGHKILSFLDAYSGYNQISMHHSVRGKTAFTTDDANYFYKVMSFGLKNVGATY